jgi:radical SAM superfamily enzyme YgiQ (UPF0313 family)
VNKKVLLVYPKKQDAGGTMSDIPLSLLYLSGAIRDIADEIIVFDFNLENNDYTSFNKLLTDKEPSIVGINCLFSGNFKTALKIADFSKKSISDVKIVLGGIHPTIFYKQILENCKNIDAIIIGEGETAFCRLLDYYFNKPSYFTENEILESVAIRIDDRILYFEKNNFIENLDNLAMPGYEYFELEKYQCDTSNWFNPKSIKISPVQAPLLTSRSCPNHCNFCAMRFVMGDKFRARSPQSVYNEIEYLYNNYGINYFQIMDDNFTFDKKRAMTICEMIIKNRLDINIDLSGGVMIRTMDEEIIDSLIKAGCIRVCIAIESGSEFIRNKIMHKNVSEKKLLETIKAFKSGGVWLRAFFMIGLPEEIEETLTDTINLIEKLNVDNITLNKVMPFPGTRLYEQCVRDNLFINNFDTENLWLGATLTNDAGPSHFVIKPYKLSMEKLYEYDNRIRNLVNEKNSEWDRHRNSLKQMEIIRHGANSKY